MPENYINFEGCMKYLLIGILVVIIGAFYLMSESNKADAERLKQAEIAHQQKLESERAAELDKQLGGTAIKKETIPKH